MQTNDAHTAIEALFQDWHLAVEAGDVDAILSLFDDDFIFKPVGRPVLSDRSAYRELLERFYQSFQKRREYRLDEVRTSGDWGWVRMTERVKLLPLDGGDPEEHPVSHMFIVAPQGDGSWKIARALSSLDHE